YKALLDDVNTPVAISEVHRLARLMHSSEGDEKRRLQAELLGLAELMGLLQQDPEDWFTLARQADDISSEDIEALIAQRTEAKLNEDYAGADAIRQELLDKGVTLEDSREDTKWRRS
ncbi:cysteine--tRNA ligase, partial [Porticoccaceae bacterium]|nr:cysteine--tRNA ligase [Porticoccaceae bacterium]